MATVNELFKQYEQHKREGQFDEGIGKLEELLKRSSEFLLEHEPKESILRQFDLSDISRYFPEYEREIRDRMAS